MLAAKTADEQINLEFPASLCFHLRDSDYQHICQQYVLIKSMFSDKKLYRGREDKEEEKKKIKCKIRNGTFSGS